MSWVWPESTNRRLHHSAPDRQGVVRQHRQPTYDTLVRADRHHCGMTARGYLLGIGIVIVVLGVFGLLVASGVPDVAIAVGGFALAGAAIWLGWRRRGAG